MGTTVVNQLVCLDDASQPMRQGPFAPSRHSRLRGAGPETTLYSLPLEVPR